MRMGTRTCVHNSGKEVSLLLVLYVMQTTDQTPQTLAVCEPFNSKPEAQETDCKSPGQHRQHPILVRGVDDNFVILHREAVVCQLPYASTHQERRGGV